MAAAGSNRLALKEGIISEIIPIVKEIPNTIKIFAAFKVIKLFQKTLKKYSKQKRKANEGLDSLNINY